MTTFHWLDYIIFAALLVASLSIGIYYRHQSSLKDAFLASRQMTLLPVTFSVMASFMSAISILGTTSEVYQFGVQYLMIGFSYFIAFPVTAEIFMPVLYRNQLTTAHHYLLLRFDKSVRLLASIIFFVQIFLYQSIVLYAPALAFQQVSGLSFVFTMLTTGLVCTVYTALGGIRAVMWTDLLQMLVVFVGFIAVVVVATVQVGGIDFVWKTAANSSRLNFLDLNIDLTQRHSLWTLVIGGAGMVLTIYSANQAQLQRYLSCNSEATARRAIYLQIPLTFVFLMCLCFCGLVIYAYYKNCDPLIAEVITKRDQLLPALVMQLFSDWPGLPGLFIACISASALSTVSSGINSLSSVVLEDFIKPTFPDITDKMSMLLTRLVPAILGFCSVGLGFLAVYLPSSVLQLALSLFGILGGPLLAVFMLGILFPCVNSKGALFGTLVSLLFTCCLGVASLIDPPPSNLKPIGQCVNASAVETVTIVTHSEPIRKLYWLSYLYYTPTALLVAIVVALSVSACTGFTREQPPKLSLIHPLLHRFITKVGADCQENTLQSQNIDENEQSQLHLMRGNTVLIHST